MTSKSSFQEVSFTRLLAMLTMGAWEYSRRTISMSIVREVSYGSVYIYTLAYRVYIVIPSVLALRGYVVVM